MADENSSFEEKISHLRKSGVSDIEIARHLSDSNDPVAREWSNQIRLDQVEKTGAAKLGDKQENNAPAPTSTPENMNTSGFKNLANVLNNGANWYANLPIEKELGYPLAAYYGIKTANLLYKGAEGVGNFVYDTLQDKIKKKNQVNAYRDIQAIKNAAATQNPAAFSAAPGAPSAPSGPSGMPPGAPPAPSGARIEPQMEAPPPFAGTEGPPPPNELNDILQRMGTTQVDNTGATPEAAPVEVTEPLRLSEWARGIQPTSETGTPAGITEEGTVTPSVEEQAAIERLTGTTEPTTEVSAKASPKGANAPVKPTTNVTLQPTGELPKQLAEVKGSIPPRVQTAAAAVPPEVQAKYAPEGKVVLKGYGSGDVSITNTYGKNAYAAIVDYFNNGQPIGTDENYKIVQGKINKGIPSELAPFFASKLPASEADAGTFGSKALGEKIGYTPQGKVVTSPNAIKNAVAKGGSIAMVLAVADAAHAAGEGDYSKVNSLPLAAVPGVGAGLGLYHGEAGAPTITQRDDALKRPEVRKTLETLKQTLSPAEYEKAARQYLNKVGSFSGMTDRERLMADIQSPYRQLPSRNTLLPVAPPR
jgi:hypothetical protein